jgi:hypothetical protein
MPQDPDIAALVARLGLRGMHYRSFGNRPVAVPGFLPPSPPAASDVSAGPAPVAMPALPAVVAPSPAPPPPPDSRSPGAFADFPLLAAAFGAAAPASPPATTEATLVFLGLRTARAAKGG